MRAASFPIVLLVLLTAWLSLGVRSAHAQAAPYDAVSYPISGVTMNPPPAGGWTALPGQIIEWEVAITQTSPLIPPGTTFDFITIPGDSACPGQLSCTMGGANPLRLLCDAPNDPDAGTGGGAIACDDWMGTNTLNITGTTFPGFGNRVCFRYTTEVDPASPGVNTGGSGCIVAGAAGTPISAPDPAAAGWPWDACAPGGTVPPTDPGGSNCAPLTIGAAPVFDFDFLKTADVATAGIGDTITWTLSITDTSTDGEDANAWVKDDIEEGMTFGMIVSDDTGVCAFDAPTTTLECDDVVFTDGAAMTIVYTTMVGCPVTISDDDSWNLCNQADLCPDDTGVMCGLSDDDGTFPGIPEPTCVNFPMVAFSNSTKTAVWTDVDMDGTVNSGDTVEYTITVMNDGDADATNVVVTDTYDPACLANVMPGPDGMDDGMTITWTPAAPIPSGNSADFTFTAEITSDMGTCDNTAFVTSDERNVCGPPDEPPVATSTSSLELGPMANVEGTKDFIISDDVNGNGIADAGDTITYTISVINTGGVVANNVDLSDVIEPCFTSCDLGALTINPPGSGTDMSNPGPLPGGRPCLIDIRGIGGGDGLDPNGTEEVTISWDLVVGDPTCCNTGTLVWQDGPGPVMTNESCLDGGAGDPVVTLDKSAVDDNGGCWAPGDTITFTLDMSSAGGDSTGVSLTDTVGAGLTIADPGTGMVAGNTITWNDIAVIPSGMNTAQRTYTATIDCDAADASVLSNSASVTTDFGMDDAEWMGAVEAPVLDITKDVSFDDADGSGALDDGEDVTWTITVTNNGSCAATNAVITDDLTAEADMALAALAVSDGGNDDGAGTISWDGGTTPALASIDPAASVVVTITGAFTAGGDDDCVDNTADVSADAACGGTGPAVGGSASATQLCGGVTPQAVLEVTKTAAGTDSDTCYEPGETVTYTITVNNIGMVDTTNMVLTDDLTLSPDITFVSASDGGVYDAPSNTITWTGTEVAAAGSIMRTWMGTIDIAAAAATVIDDTATADADNAEAATANWSNMVEVAGFVVTKTRTWTANDPLYDLDDNGVPSEGDLVDYTITVDASACSANNVVVTDILDPDIKWTAGDVTVNDGGVYDEPSWTITWDEAGNAALAEVAVAGPVTLTFTATIDEVLAQGGFDGNVDNTADVSGGWGVAPDSASAARLVIGGGMVTVDLLVNEDFASDLATRLGGMNVNTLCAAGTYEFTRLDPVAELETADVDPSGNIIFRMGTGSAGSTGAVGDLTVFELHEHCQDIVVNKDGNNDILITNAP